MFFASAGKTKLMSRGGFRAGSIVLSKCYIRNLLEPPMPQAVFVYGTLKRGQSRENCWPHQPLSIDAATVRGTLFDLGPYPGLVAGNDLIAGELWLFAAEDMPPTLAVLDEVEGFYNQPDDEYSRVIVECLINDKTAAAWAYYYARSAALTSSRRIRPDDRGICHWPAPIP